MSKTIPRPPKASCGLFVVTVLLVIAICFVYFSWYLEGEWRQGLQATVVWKTVVVTPGDDLQQKIEASAAHTILALADGDYRGEFKVRGKSDLTLRGSGNSKLIAPAATTLSFEDCSSCRLENLEIRSEDPRYRALSLNHVKNFYGERLHIHAEVTAVRIQSRCEKVVIKKSTINGALVGEHGRNFTLGDSHLQHRQGIACQLTDFTLLLIDNNEIKASSGIHLRKISTISGYQNCLLRNAIIASSGDALSIEESRDLLLTSNRCEAGENGSGLRLLNCKNMQIGKGQFGNKIKAQKGAALQITASDKVAVNDNWFTSHSENRATVQIETGRRIDLWKNQISGLAEFREGSLHSVKGGGCRLIRSLQINLRHNRILHSQVAGLSIAQESQVRIEHNIIEKNQGAGVEVLDSQVTLGPGNDIRANLKGVAVAAVRGKIYQNTIAANQKDGIILKNSTLAVLNNRVENNGNDGLSLEGSSVPEIKGNQFIANKGYGIFFPQAPTSSWKNGNEFRDNQRGPANWPHKR